MIAVALGTVVVVGVLAFTLVAALMLAAIRTCDDDPWYQDGEFE